MAQSMFDVLTGVPLTSPSVQWLLEPSTLMTQVEQSALEQDDEDIFQCGRCKSQFTSLHMFILHKKAHQKAQEQTVDLSKFIVSDQTEILQTEDIDRDRSSYSPQETFVQMDQLGESIVLEEADMLFSMDREGTNYFTTDSTFGVPIILSSESLDTFENSAMMSDNEPLKDDSDDRVSQILKEEDMANSEDYQITPTETSSTETDNLGDNQVKNLKYKCAYCSKQFSKKFYWQQHERSHTGEKPYQCVVCGRAFAQKSNVKKHMSSHKVWPGTAIHSLPPEAPLDGSIDRTYHCQFCKEIFDSYKALKAHLILSHLTLKVYKCVQSSCSMMFAELEDFLDHTRSHKRSEYRCHVCGEVFNTLSDLGCHQYVHSVHKQKTTEKYYCCSVCKSSFSNLDALQHHTETTTHDYACLHCGKSFLIERFLRRHLKTHASSARFACEDCGKAFKTEQYLANHKLIHSEETPFHCPDCPATFKRKDRLGRHMLIHDVSKRLKCPFKYLGCVREFSRPDKLKRHLLTHNNIKRFNCNDCNRNFHRAQALKHYEIHKHSLECDICLYAFKSKEQLLTHNCDQLDGTKKHSNTQLPKKASGSFKPRKPTPKRQISTKVTTGLIDREKLVQKKVDTDALKINKEENNLFSKDDGTGVETTMRSNSVEAD